MSKRTKWSRPPWKRVGPHQAIVAEGTEQTVMGEGIVQFLACGHVVDLPPHAAVAVGRHCPFCLAYEPTPSMADWAETHASPDEVLRVERRDEVLTAYAGEERYSVRLTPLPGFGPVSANSNDETPATSEVANIREVLDATDYP